MNNIKIWKVKPFINCTFKSDENFQSGQWLGTGKPGGKEVLTQ